MSDKQVVLAIFENEAAADAAVEALKDWDKADDDIKLNAIGVLVLDDDGKIKTHKLGRRSTAKGAGIGLVLAIIAPVSLVGGVIGGGVLGALHHKGLGIKSEERDRIAAELERRQGRRWCPRGRDRRRGGVGEARRARGRRGGADRQRGGRGRSRSGGSGRGGRRGRRTRGLSERAGVRADGWPRTPGRRAAQGRAAQDSLIESGHRRRSVWPGFDRRRTA